jgi:tetratricopeptide (TPR) repeat protein
MTEQTPSSGLNITKRRKTLMRAVVVCGLVAVIGFSLWRAWNSTEWAANRRVEHIERLLTLWRVEDAAVELSACREQWPALPRVHLLSARAARLREKYDDADRHLRDFLRVGGSLEEHQLESRLLSAYRGLLGDVEEPLSEQAERDPSDRLFIFDALVTGYRKTLRLGSFRKCLDRWLELDPNAVPALLHEAWHLEQANRQEDAADLYAKILARDPDNDSARFYLSAILVNQFRSDQALEHLAVLQKRRPNDPLVLTGLARCWYLQGKFDDARRALDQALEKQPNDAGILGQRGLLALKTQDWQAAEQFFRRASALKPFEYLYAYNLHQSLIHQNKSAEADEQLVRAEKLSVDQARMRDLVVDEIPRRPHDPRLRHEAGVILQGHGDYAEAIRWLQSALREDPNHRATHLALAECYDKTNRGELADEHRRLAGVSIPP